MNTESISIVQISSRLQSEARLTSQLRFSSSTTPAAPATGWRYKYPYHILVSDLLAFAVELFSQCQCHSTLFFLKKDLF